MANFKLPGNSLKLSYSLLRSAVKPAYENRSTAEMPPVVPRASMRILGIPLSIAELSTLSRFHSASSHEKLPVEIP